MAPQLSLIRREDFSSDIETLDLLSGGFDVRSWLQAIASEGDTSVSEVVTLKITGSSQDNLASLIQSLDEKIKQVGWYAQAVEQYGVWLRAKLGNETNPRQALILSVKRSPVVTVFDAPAGRSNIIREYQLGLDRIAWWEDTTEDTFTVSHSPGINVLGGMWNYGTIIGDVPARMGRLKLTSTNGLRELWIGFRSPRFGTPANLQPIWELELGSTGTDTTAGSPGSDATASNSNKITTTFATDATLISRITILATNVTLNPDDQRGTFQVLLRAKCSNGSTTCRARLRSGYVASETGMDSRSRIVISGTSWLLYEMGEVQIPSPGRVLTTLFQPINAFAFGIDAERIAGSGNLEMDCLILIPTAEGFCYVDAANLNSTSNPVNLFDRPDGKTDGVQILSGTIGGVVTTKIFGGVPVGNGNLVVAGQRSTQTIKTDVIGFELYTFARWATLRGAE